MNLKNILDKFREKREEFKTVQRQDKIQELVQQRKKNSNERELERFMEEERQKEIKSQLEMFRKKRAKEVNGMKILGGKNIFKGHKNILTDNKKLFGMHNDFGAAHGGMYFK